MSTDIIIKNVIASTAKQSPTKTEPIHLVHSVIWVFNPKQYKKLHNCFTFWVDAQGIIISSPHDAYQHYIGIALELAQTDFTKTHNVYEIR
jgi:hypothetical protein